MEDKPLIIQRIEEQLLDLQNNPLPENYNVMLDISKTVQDKWRLHFTQGLYFFHGAMKQTPASVIHINKNDYEELIIYSLYFDPYTGVYEISKPDEYCGSGHFVGDFMINGCKLIFNPPQDECWKYIGSFSNGFSDGYFISGEFKNICTECRYSIEFNNDFQNVTLCENP